VSENANPTATTAESVAPKGDTAASAEPNANASDSTAAKDATSQTGSPGESPELQALRAKLGLSKKAPESADPKAKIGESTTETPAAVADTATTSTAVADGGSTEEEVDTTAATGAALLARKDRALKEKAEKVKLQAKEIADQKAELAPVITAREKLKSAKDAKERALALLELVGGQVTIDDISELSTLAGQERPALTEEDVDKRVAAKLEAAEKAAKEKAEREAKETAERITASEQKQVQAAAEFLAENAKKYPAIMYRGVAPERYVALMKEGYAATKKIPSAELIYDFIENEYREEAKKQLLSVIAPPPPVVEAKPAKTVTSDDKRGVVTKPEEKEEKEEVKEKVEDRIARKRAEALKKIKAKLESRTQ
jgi:hypothetical protein